MGLGVELSCEMLEGKRLVPLVFNKSTKRSTKESPDDTSSGDDVDDLLDIFLANILSLREDPHGDLDGKRASDRLSEVEMRQS